MRKTSWSISVSSMNRREKTTPNSTKKFLFDVHNFDEGEKEDEVEAPPPPPVFSQEELAAAKNEAYQQGKKDGFGEAQASFEKQVLDLLGTIRTNFNVLFDEEERRGRSFEKETVQLAYTIFAKAFPALNERFGLDEVRSVLQKVLETVREQPEIMIEVPSAYAEAIQRHIDGILRHDSSPHCIVRGSDVLSAGQCRMAWQNGTAIRNGARLANRIREQIEQVLADKAILTDNEPDTPSPAATQNGDGHE